jgi:hypothetical protein
MIEKYEGKMFKKWTSLNNENFMITFLSSGVDEAFSDLRIYSSPTVNHIFIAGNTQNNTAVISTLYSLAAEGLFVLQECIKRNSQLCARLSSRKSLTETL